MISPALAHEMARNLGVKLSVEHASPIAGGCINECFRLESSRGPLFVKIADAARISMLEAEVAGLEELARADAVRVPRVLTRGCAEESAFLVLEWIEFRSASSTAEARLGEQLAQLHHTSAQVFGWQRDNTIGLTPQINTCSSAWVSFFREHRLKFQLDLAHRNGYTGRLQERGARLLEKMDLFFKSYQPTPSLLHGDLWAGNWGVDEHGAPVIFDPAVYYGDREADIAMTRLFGGFGASFYSAYQASWPLDSGFETRATLYNLYHILNHLNLFGSGYRSQAEAMIERLLAELG